MDDKKTAAQPVDWATKYPVKANLLIGLEAIYLLIVIVFCAFMLFLIYTTEDKNTLHYILSAWVAGMLGGALYAVKWLYSSVKDAVWLEDMWIWRVLTPVTSGALGFAMILIVYSEIFSFLKPESVSSFEGSFVIGFLTGYVSDAAVKKMKEMAETLFGTKKEDALEGTERKK
jgi:hypothetical protein